MKNLMFALASIFLLGACAQTGQQPGDDTSAMLASIYPCSATIPDTTGSPTMLVIGDSISIGYTPFLVPEFPTLQVVHNPCNAMTSDYTRDHIASWLATRPSFDVITFNNGMWDINEWCQVPLDRYKANLVKIAEAVKAKTAHPYFVLTTQVPNGANGRTDARAIAYNAAAVEVMNAEGIPVIDLHTYSATFPELHVDPTNVHWTDQGSRNLADFIVAAIANNF